MMYDTTRARRPLALAGAALLVSLGAAITAPNAFAAPAATGSGITLKVDGPAAIGFAGRPVEFTETIGNTGTTTAKHDLVLDADAGPGVPENGLSMEYLTDSGSWEKGDVSYGGGVFESLLPLDAPVGPGESRTVRVRIGLPMGEPHNGDSNGGTDSITLKSTVSTPGPWVAEARDTRTIAVASPSERLSGVPATAVAGGKPAEFNAVLTNGTPSAYENLGHVLFTERHTTVQVRRDGVWTTLPAVPLGSADPDEVGYYLDGRDSSLAAGATTTTPVRVSWDAGAPLGRTTLRSCLYVNESAPFRGTTMCQSSATVTVVGGESDGGGTPKPSASASAPGSSATPSAGPSQSAGHTGSPSPSATPSASTPSGGTSTSPLPLTGTGQLASTGSDGKGMLAASTGAALLLLGGGVLAVVSRRRRHNRA